jgi:hypothetical protein
MNIDACIIANEDYAKRVAQEIYRVTPEDGAYISIGSPYIEREAEKLFPFKEEISGVIIYSKSELQYSPKTTNF